jgi:hypothetical protein
MLSFIDEFRQITGLLLAMNDVILTIKQMAEHLKMGNYWRLKCSELEAWIKMQQCEKREAGSV